MGLEIFLLTSHAPTQIINLEEHVIYGSIRFYNVARGQNCST